jgi:2-iminobutanoate/2-iminopropanoate deaminase
MRAVGVQPQFPTGARVAFEACCRAAKLDAILDYREHLVVPFIFPAFARSPPMRRISAVLLAILLSSAAHAAEYMEKTPFQLSRAFSPGVITSGGTIVWVAGQTATQDSQGNNIANNFDAQVKQVFAQIDGIMKRAGGSLDNVVTMTVFIKESRYGDKFVEMRRDFFKNGSYPDSALITVTNFARPGIEIEIQAVGVVGDTCSSDNPCSAEGKAKKAQNR